MKTNHNTSPDAAALRRIAEERLKTREQTRRSEFPVPRSDERLVHELRVHQIELEMQNEELQRTRAQAEELLAQYTDLYDFAPVGYLTLSEQGLILKANLSAATLLGSARGALINRPISRFILKEDRDLFSRHRTGICKTPVPQSCELRLVKSDGTPFWAQLATVVVEQAADGASVCRLVLSDINESKRAEEALKRAHNELEQRVAEQTEELGWANAELHALALHLNDVREEERATLARELHDDLGQHLTALQIDLTWLDRCLQAAAPPDLAQLHDRIVAMVPMVERLTELTQTVCASLRPGVLDDLGLVAAIEWQAEDTAKRTGLTCETALPASDIEVDGTIALVVFRIIQESLTNVVRHAQATHVTISLHTAGDVLELEIQDNGRGGAPETFAGHTALGLIGMRERARACGGTVDIGSDPGKGTTVRVRVPAQPMRSGGQP
jgi:PAS domain S-box-containing protein